MTDAQVRSISFSYCSYCILSEISYFFVSDTFLPIFHQIYHFVPVKMPENQS